MATNLVDDRGWIVLLFRRRKTLAFIENDLLLLGLNLALLGLRNWSNELRAAAAFDGLLCRLALGVQFPVLVRVVVWRI